MTRWFMLPFFLALAACLATVQRVEAQTTLLQLSSESGDYIGQGLTRTLTPTDGTFTATRNFSNGVSIDFNGPTSNWHLDFSAPNSATLAVGSYENAERFPFQAAGRPGLSVSGEGRGCNTLTGRFTVAEVVFGSGSNVLSFAASFEQHCEGAGPALFGSIVFNTAPPTFTVTVTRAGSGVGTVTSFPAGISCGTDCTESYVIGTVVALTATPDPGLSFGGWSGSADCSDGRITQSLDVSCTATFLATPSAPSDLRAEVTGHDVRFTWNLPADSPSVSTYMLDVGSAAGSSNLGSFPTGSAQKFAVVAGVSTGVYYVRVRAVNVYGSSGSSNEVEVRVPRPTGCFGPPAAPFGFAATVVGEMVTLTWSQPLELGIVTSYIVEAGSASGLADLTVFDTVLYPNPISVRAPRGAYFVRVRARNDCGVSGPSNEILVVVF